MPSRLRRFLTYRPSQDVPPRRRLARSRFEEQPSTRVSAGDLLGDATAGSELDLAQTHLVTSGFLDEWAELAPASRLTLLEAMHRIAALDHDASEPATGQAAAAAPHTSAGRLRFIPAGVGGPVWTGVSGTESGPVPP